MKVNRNLLMHASVVCAPVAVYGVLLVRGLKPRRDVDTQDPSWQVSDRFQPDKDYAWTHDDINHNDGWNFAHEAIKGEIEDFHSSLLKVVKREYVSTEQVKAARKWWNGHEEHMRNHLKNEDKVTKKFVGRRFQWPAFMQDDHAKIDEYLQKIDLHIVALSHGAPSDRVQTMRDIFYSWHEYRKFIVNHLKQWEEIGKSLTRAYFTPLEVREMTTNLGRLSSKVETGAIVHYVGERRLEEAMAAQNTATLVSQLAWTLFLKPRHRYYKKSMIAQLRILRCAHKSGGERRPGIL